MQNRFRSLIATALGLALLSLPASAGAPKSMTKTLAGISYKLTVPNPLPMGQQKLILKLSKGTQVIKGARLTGIASMADAMKSPLTITPKPSGEFELKTQFTMGGEWNLKLQQTAPVKAQITFTVIVEGGMGKMHM